MENLNLSTPTPDDELMQPGDPDGEIPPTYSAGHLPEGEPREAVTRARPVFYGPVSGPFTVNSNGELLQAPADWTGYIRMMPDGTVLHVHESQFNKHYQWTDEAGIATTDLSQQERIRELEDELAEAQSLIATLNLDDDEGREPEPGDEEELIQPDE